MARDAPVELDETAMALPTAVADEAAVRRLVERYDLGSPVGRLLEALGAPPLN